jgi:hypothetical protein
LFLACQAGKNEYIFPLDILLGIDKIRFSYYYAQMTMRQNEIQPRFGKGQQVVIKPVDEKGVTKREYDVNAYAGTIGEISDYYYISLRSGQVFFVYHVRVGKEKKEIVVYEDELEPVLFSPEENQFSKRSKH